MKNRPSDDAAQGACVVLGDLSRDKERLCLVTQCGGGMFFFFLRGRGLGELKYLEKDERVQCAPSSLCKHGERVENLWSCRTKDEVGGISVVQVIQTQSLKSGFKLFTISFSTFYLNTCTHCLFESSKRFKTSPDI